MRINEIMKAKVDSVKPGVEATVDNGDGTKTVVDLKKNPNALSKGSDGKVKLATKPKPGQKNPADAVKPGDDVEIDAN